MPRFLFTALFLCAASAAQAECYADYKAKQNDPLRLAYGVAQVSDGNCDPGAAQAELESRLAGQGWTLLNVMTVFGPEGLAEREGRAGDHFLRY